MSRPRAKEAGHGGGENARCAVTHPHARTGMRPRLAWYPRCRSRVRPTAHTGGLPRPALGIESPHAGTPPKGRSPRARPRSRAAALHPRAGPGSAPRADALRGRIPGSGPTFDHVSAHVGAEGASREEGAQSQHTREEHDWELRLAGDAAARDAQADDPGGEGRSRPVAGKPSLTPVDGVDSVQALKDRPR